MINELHFIILYVHTHESLVTPLQEKSARISVRCIVEQGAVQRSPILPKEREVMLRGMELHCYDVPPGHELYARKSESQAIRALESAYIHYQAVWPPSTTNALPVI